MNIKVPHVGGLNSDHVEGIAHAISDEVTHDAQAALAQEAKKRGIKPEDILAERMARASEGQQR